MVALLAIYLLAPQHYPDRAKFLEALAALPERAPVAAVLKALGKPDRIDPPGTVLGAKTKSTQTWFYGTDGPNGAATLARLLIYDGEIGWHPVDQKPPPASVISESELRKGMHIVLDATPPADMHIRNTTYTKWMVKTANALLPFGEAKCKAIVSECGRLVGELEILDPSLFFLTYVLFDPPSKPGYFDEFGPVWYVGQPEDHAKQPRWPVEIIDNVPIIHGTPMGGFGGAAPSFNDQYRRLQPRIDLRKSPLTAPK